MDEQREKDIRELALNIFKRKLQFTFKANVDPDTIDKLVASEPFQYYIEQATKQYDKRTKALAVNKNYPVIEVPADGVKDVAGGAWCLCFVYTKHKGNFVLKGYMREVEAYLKKNYTHYFCNFSLWWLGAHRDIWKFWNKDIGIHEPHRESKMFTGDDRWKFQVRPYTSWHCSDEEREKAKEKVLYFKRMPKRWIPEFDEI